MPSNHLRTLIVGSSGHASVLIEAMQLAETYLIIGMLDDTLEPGLMRNGYRVLGKIADAQSICERQSAAGVAIAIGDNWQRRRIYTDLIQACPTLSFPIIKHPSAMIAATAEVGEGAVLLSGSHIGPNSRVGSFCILNTGSSLDHDCVIGDFSSLAPGVFTGGRVSIGEGSAIGVGASISDRISIGSHCVVGNGAVVVRNIPPKVVAYGNPAIVRRSRDEGEPYL